MTTAFKFSEGQKVTEFPDGAIVTILKVTGDYPHPNTIFCLEHRKDCPGPFYLIDCGDGNGYGWVPEHDLE